MLERVKGDFLQWLRGFCAVADSGSVSSAAERLGLSQPAVSHLLHSLEQDLGVHLFTRYRKNMVITDEGHQLYEKALALMEMVTEIRSEVGRADKGTYKGAISFATTHSVAVSILPQHLLQFRTLHPQISFSIITGAESGFTINKIIDSTIDFGIAIGDTFADTLLAYPLFTTRLVLAVPKHMHFSRDERGYLSHLEELHDMPFMSFSKAVKVTNFIETELHSKGICPQQVLIANNSNVLKTYVATGIGVAIVEEFVTKNKEAEFDVYPLPGAAAHSHYHLLTRRRKYLPPQSAAFITHLLKAGMGAQNLDTVIP